MALACSRSRGGAQPKSRTSGKKRLTTTRRSGEGEKFPVRCNATPPTVVFPGHHRRPSRGCLRFPASPLAWCRMLPCARSHSCKRSRSEWRAVRRRRKRTPLPSSSLRTWRPLCSWAWMRRSFRTRFLTWACMACSRSPWDSRSTRSSSRSTRPTIRQAAALTTPGASLLYVRGTRASLLRAVRTRGAGQLAPGPRARSVRRTRTGLWRAVTYD